MAESTVNPPADEPRTATLEGSTRPASMRWRAPAMTSSTSPTPQAPLRPRRKARP